MGVRRYRVKYSAYSGTGGYSVKTRDFRSLRAAGEFIRDLPENQCFDEIRAVEVTTLSSEEMDALAMFSDGAFVAPKRAFNS